MPTSDPKPQCDIRGCVGVGIYEFLEIDNRTYQIKECVNLCQRHELIISNYYPREDDDA